MCIAFPGEIVALSEDGYATIDIGGTRREVSLDLVADEVALGDYVICHAGFAIHRVDEEQARERLELLREILAQERG